MNEEYRKILLDLYKENISFLNKAIFSISSLSIAFLVQLSFLENFDNLQSIILVLTIFIFLAVLTIQMLSLKIARDGCDKSLSEDSKEQDEGYKLFQCAKKLERCKEWLFIIAIVMIFISVNIKLFN